MWCAARTRLKVQAEQILQAFQAHPQAFLRALRDILAGQGIRLPACSSDFNPIEQAFAKLKALLRTAAARTVPDLRQAIRDAFAAFRPTKGRNHITAAGADAHDPT